MTTPQFGVPSPVPQRLGRWAQTAQTGHTTPETSPSAASVPPAVPTQGYYQQPMPLSLPGVMPKKKGTAAVLAFFLGGWGAHNFYMGDNSLGFAKLFTVGCSWMFTLLGLFGLVESNGEDGLEMLAFGLLLGAITGIWVFVEFIMILMGAGNMAKDSRGYKLI